MKFDDKKIYNETLKKLKEQSEKEQINSNISIFDRTFYHKLKESKTTLKSSEKLQENVFSSEDMIKLSEKIDKESKSKRAIESEQKITNNINLSAFKFEEDGDNEIKKGILNIGGLSYVNHQYSCHDSRILDYIHIFEAIDQSINDYNYSKNAEPTICIIKRRVAISHNK